MKKILELFGPPKTKGQFGIEVEVEGKGLEELSYSAECPWKTEPDNSLRGRYPEGACEYVLAKPIPYGRVSKALEILNNHLKKAREVNFSFRTSVHVHYNVQDFTTTEVMNMIYTYTLLEGMFMRFCGEIRNNNRFCLRVRDAEGIIPILQEGFSTDLQSFRLVNENHARYSSLNICSLNKYGSIEFRGMQGTSDEKRLMTWVTAIHYLGEYAKSKKNPSEVYNDFVDSASKRHFVDKVLRDLGDVFYTKDQDKEIDLSFSLSIDLPFSYAASQRVAEKAQEHVINKQPAAPLNLDDLRNQRVVFERILENAPGGAQGVQWEVPGFLRAEVARPRAPARRMLPAEADLILHDDILDDIE